MGNPSREEFYALIASDLEAKIADKDPEPILLLDFNAMAASSAHRRAGMITDGMAWISDNADIMPEQFHGVFRDVAAASLLNGMKQSLVDLFVGQFANDFEKSFGSFCDKVMRHLDKLEGMEDRAEAISRLRGGFLQVVTAPDLDRERLAKVIENVQRRLTDNFMPDERGELTKAYMTFDKALELGLLDRVEYAPYAAAQAAPTFR
jgi:hypothetical protein